MHGAPFPLAQQMPASEWFGIEPSALLRKPDTVQ